MKTIRLILLALLVCGGLAAQSTEDLYKKLDATYGKLTTFEANIKQTNHFAQIKQTLTYTGKIWFREGKMVIRFDKPAFQRLQISNAQVELYDQASNTLFRTAMLPEFGKMNPVDILRHYWTKSKVKVLKTEKGLATVQLIPDRDPMISTMSAVMNSQTGLVNSLSYEDNAGNKVTYVFSNILTNQPIKADVWKYNYPKGTQVVQQ
ncbi:MAG TPA: outer membrane lipoprotein carrier protein LolA [Candidatus Cloacimonadota bacterium]|jgi:outer membrane lipoprotein-sorting protein|nr:outer membrane lipoprotein carrier protein LolA [Candidatus Cloacimonadota bacterium]